VDSIVRLNGLTNADQLSPGMVISIPASAKNYGTIEVNGYIEPATPAQDTAVINDVGPYLTYSAPFSYQVNADGSLNPINDEAILSAGRPYRIAPLLVITNFSGGNFSTPLVDTILTNASIQDTLINNVVQTMRTKGYYGLNIDFERISPQNKDAYSAFLRKVVGVLRPQGFPTCTSLAPKSSGDVGGAWHAAHDYPTIGGIVDFVILMTYEWGWSGGPPYAVAPVDLVEDVIRYAVSVMPTNKIIMGMPLYGYDWQLPYMPRGPWAKRVSPPQAIALAARYGAVIQFDAKTQSPFFNYTDEHGQAHVVWFEDARSVRAKLLLVNKYGLRGVSYWVLGVPFPQNWLVLDDMFNIEKLVP
jgi:spore germination protein